MLLFFVTSWRFIFVLSVHFDQFVFIYLTHSHIFVPTSAQQFEKNHPWRWLNIDFTRFETWRCFRFSKLLNQPLPLSHKVPATRDHVTDSTVQSQQMSLWLCYWSVAVVWSNVCPKCCRSLSGSQDTKRMDIDCVVSAGGIV